MEEGELLLHRRCGGNEYSLDAEARLRWVSMLPVTGGRRQSEQVSVDSLRASKGQGMTHAERFFSSVVTAVTRVPKELSRGFFFQR